MPCIVLSQRRLKFVKHRQRHALAAEVQFEQLGWYININSLLSAFIKRIRHIGYTL